MEAQEIAKARRHDLDWLRVILFALLIWFHYAVFSLWQLEGSSGGMEGSTWSYSSSSPLCINSACVHCSGYQGRGRHSHSEGEAGGCT